MNLNLKKPIVFFDIESTGLDVVNDRIVELSLIKVNPDQSQESKLYLINPQIPISPAASAVHGITDAKVANCPTFKEVANEIYNFIGDSDLAGFNSNRFDIPMLIEELLRVNLTLDIENKKCIDVQTIFHIMEKRTLEAAYKFYCNKQLTNAHSADADTRATLEVLMAQLDKYPDIPNDIDEIAKKFEIQGEIQYVDSAKRIMKNGNQYILNFGKYKGQTFQDIYKKDPGYFQWMYHADFGLHTKQKLKEICKKLDIKI